MSELYFRLGEMKGFTAIDLADQKEGYANPIRELLQNSLDASREAGERKCEINIYIEEIPTRAVPHIDDYENVLKKAIKTAKDQGSFNANSEQLVRPIQIALRKKKLEVLMFADNGIGMKQDRLEAILTGGVSIKGDENSGGSFGVGNLSSYSLSSLRYVLYATKHEDNNGKIKMLFTGSPILAGYRDGRTQRGNRGRIVTKKPTDEMNPEFVYPEDPPDFIKSKMQNLDMGTMVTILGLSETWDEDAEYAIVSNFFHALAHDGLSINVHQDVHQESVKRKISYDDANRLIADKKDGQRARGENILSGKAVYQAWQTVTERETQKTIKLSNADKIYVCIKNDNNAESVVVLVRNGMVVARHDSMLSDEINWLRKDPSFEFFTAVIDVDKKDAPELFRLVKDAEGPYHNQLKAKKLDSTDKKRLRWLFEELSKKIKEHLKPIKIGSEPLPLFTIPEKATPPGDGRNGLSGQDDRANTQPFRGKPFKPKKPKPGKNKKRPKPVVVSRNLKSKNAVRYTSEDTHWKVRLRIIPEKQEDAKNDDEVYLSICLAEDNDKEEAKTYLDFIAVTINGRTIEILDSVDVIKDGELRKEPANKNQIKLGPLGQAKSYNITAEVKKPDEVGDMKVALLPILGLKQRKNTKD